MKIEIIIIAIVLVVLIVVGFIISDRNKKREDVDEIEEKESIRDDLTEEEIIDYNVYKMSVLEFVSYFLLGGAGAFIIGYIFYQSIILSAILSITGLLFVKMQKKRLLHKRKLGLSRQFQQALFSLSSSLVAGRSIENAFKEVTTDLKLLYPDPDTYIIGEFELINRRIENQDAIEVAIQDFSDRAGIEDISNFTDVFTTCKRTGGDLVEVIRRTSTLISEKIEIQQGISVMVAQKKFESNALSILPVIMIALLGYTAGDYMNPLYDFPGLGPIVMTVCLGIIIFAYWVSQRIMNIKV